MKIYFQKIVPTSNDKNNLHQKKHNYNFEILF